MSYNTIEPTAVNDQVNPEIADIARKEGIDPIEVTALRLDYKNILKIDNLWAFENLTKLQLDNNIIEKIENINFLRNLQWLDLSFNNITSIEGLDGLTKLTDLTLFNNRISKLENMEDLVNLTLLYLTRFENLRVLNCSGNTLCKNPNFKHYVLAHIRGLKYLDYRLVDEESIAASREKYIDDLIAMEEEEKILNSKKEELRKKQEQDVLFEAAHILGIDTLFDDMFLEDVDYQRLYISAPDRIQDLQDDYRAKFEVVVNELRHFVLKRHSERQEEHKSFMDCMQNAKGEIDGECLKALDKYSHYKKQMLRLIQTSRDTKEIDEGIKMLKDDTNELSDRLVGLEMQLPTSINLVKDVIKEFERNYTELCTGINEYGQTAFAQKFSENVLAAFERFNKGDNEDADDELRDIMSDKDTLVNSINSSHDYHLSQFDRQEDSLVSGVAKDLELLVQKLHDDEVRRNRDRICEIIAFLDKCTAEIEQAEENAY
ncbi:hypothetical protein BC829DRAFT_426505 [Chytridium lagenaria]|nr:hypothetical protein BC829DRAFT_426505 [Chytridium lagenaria]